MNVPRKHHYLPQVHISNFRKNDRFLIYDKLNDKHFSKNSSNDLFEVKDSNVILNESFELDYVSEEKYFHDTYESRFNEHYGNLVGFLDSNSIISTSNFTLAINFFLEYAIIGHNRALRVQANYYESNKEFEKDLLDVFSRFKWVLKLFNIGNKVSVNKQFAAYRKRRILEESLLKVPIANLKDISKILPLNYRVVLFLNDKNNFHLPDSCAIIFKNPKATHVFSDQISRVLIPLSNQIVLDFIVEGSCINSEIVNSSTEQVDEINNYFLNHSFRWIIK